MIALPHMQVAVWATDSPMPIHRASGMAATQGQSTCSTELRSIATHPLTRLCFPTIAHQWKFAEYYTLMQQKSETLLSLRDTIEHWRTTPYDVLFKEMKG